MNQADMWSRSVAGQHDDAAPVDPDEESPSLSAGASPGEADQPGPARRRRRRLWFLALGLVFLIGATLGVIFVPTPYVLLEPGSVRSAEDRISVSGAETFEPDADVLFTTVLVDQATVLGLLRGAIDDAIEVHTQEEIYGTRSRDETQEMNRQQMDLSKLVAAKEALELMGYEASFTGKGARVVEVLPHSASDGVLVPGDVIVGIEGAPVTLPADLRGVLDGKVPGDPVKLSVRRSTVTHGELASSEESETVELEVTLGEAADDPARGVLGIEIEPQDPAIESELDVEIDSGAVSGPSAGLAWSLGIVDLLTPGDLARGGDVAVTGEMLPDGSVGRIGGVVQKVATVKRAGVKVFLYPAATPAEEQEEMRRVAGDELELVPVATLQEAVEYLDPDLELPPPG